MKILVAVSSPLVRINGIMKFVSEVATVLHAAGHQVDFITDALPDSGYDVESEFDSFYYDATDHNYPNLRVLGQPGVVDVVYIPEMSERIDNLYTKIDKQYDLIISNDAQCTKALSHTGICLHYVHTAGLLPGEDCSFLNPTYIEFERQMMQKAKWVGLHSQPISDLLNNPKNGIILGLPLTNAADYSVLPDQHRYGVLFAGEGTYRKGADIFEDILSQIPWANCKLMCSDTSQVNFAKIQNKEIRKFDETQQDAKQQFIKSAKFTFFPSRGETMGYGLLEALLSGPALVYSEFAWTKCVMPLGAIPTDPARAVHDVIRGLYGELPHYPELVLDYFKLSTTQWTDFVASLQDKEIGDKR